MKNYLKWLFSQGKMFLAAFSVAAIIVTAGIIYYQELFSDVSGAIIIILILSGFIGGMVYQSIQSYNSSLTPPNKS